MLSITEIFIVVLRAFVTGSEIDDKIKAEFLPEVIEKLFNISEEHDVTQIVSEVLFKNGLLSKGKKITEKYKESQITALYRYMNIEREQQSIYNLFESNKIEFIPLKGAVIRQYYPDPYMRTSCDIDVLVREEDLQRAAGLLVANLSYTRRETVDFHDISLFSPSGVHLELHYNIKEKREDLDKLLIKVWDYCIGSEKGEYHKLETPEFYIFHHIAHMVNHFLRGGCGIRPFIDLYFIIKEMKYDNVKLLSMLKMAKCEEFYDSIVHCIEVWFGAEKPSERSRLIEEFLLKGGIYGTKSNRIKIDQSKKGGKNGYLFSRIFLSYDILKYKYVVLQKCKILLPFVWIIRILSLFSREKRKRMFRELELRRKISKETEVRVDKMLDFLGM